MNEMMTHCDSCVFTVLTETYLSENTTLASDYNRERNSNDEKPDGLTGGSWYINADGNYSLPREKEVVAD
jgi:hypothetical protein